MNQIVKIPDGFRKTFKTIDKDLIRWFPGHMGKGLKQMQQKLKSVDCIVEVHDCRIPFSGRNIDFKYSVSGIKPHILVMNKKDMIEKQLLLPIKKHLEKDEKNVIFTNCKEHTDGGIRKIVNTAENLIVNSERFNRENSKEFNIMVIGVPNVGKSSVINCLRNFHLRKSNATRVGAVPGITKSVLNRIKVSENPDFYLFDTPGILTPKITDIESGLKLALCANLQDHLVGELIIADYLLYYLNKHGIYKYVQLFRLEEATDDITKVLVQISKNLNRTIKFKRGNDYVIKPDLLFAAKYMLKCFRTGELGKIMLDIDVFNDGKI